MKFVTDLFKGQVPLLAPHLLKDEYATYTENCGLKRMSLRPSNRMEDTGFVFDQQPKSIFPHYTVPLETLPGIDTGVFDGWFWFEYKTKAFFSVLPNDKYDRIYFLDEDGKPRITDEANINLNASTPSVTTSWKLGVPAPTGACSGSNNGDGVSAVLEDRAYVYTFVDRWGAEGPPSPPSNIVPNVKSDGSVAVTGMDAFPAGYNFTGGVRRLYRAVSGATRTDYLYIEETSGTSLTDERPPERLGEVIPTRTWFPPPDFIEDWAMAPNGALVGFANNTLYFSLPYLPSAWPPDYQIAINHDIKGLAAIGQSVAVMTNNNPYVITGVIPMAAQPRKLDLEEACINSDSIVSIGNTAYYASPNGITVVSQGDAGIMSASTLTREQWEKFAPEITEAINYQDDFLMFYDATGLPDTNAEHILDRDVALAPVKGAMSMDEGEYYQFWTDYVSAPVIRPHDETFFGAAEDDGVWRLYEINPVDPTGALERSFTWRSKVILQEKPINFACAQIEADRYPIRFTLWADGDMVFQKEINSLDVFRLPGGFKARTYQFELVAQAEIRKVTMAESIMEMSES